MDAEYTIRNMEESDIAGLEKLVMKEWFSKYEMSEEFRNSATTAYVSMYSSRCTSAYAFETGGKVVGYLLGSASGQPLVFPDQKMNLDIADNEYTQLCRKVLAADERMVESCKGRGFDSELLLFIVNSDCRGMRIGTRLLDRFARDAVSTGHKLMYLFTDDYCNMGFYDRIGCKEAARETVFADGSNHTFVMLELDLTEYVQKSQ